MTNEEAAKLVEEAFGICYNECDSSEEIEKYSEACNMAVAALKGQKIIVAQIVLDEKRLQEICKKSCSKYL